LYLCNRNTEAGPFVYRLGRMVFIHVRAVRFRYGLLLFCRLKVV
jgi:hypothetical protein